MSAVLDLRIKSIEALARVDDPEALTQASKLTEQFPGEAKTWVLRAYVLGREGRWAEAISDLTRAIGIWPNEPELFFHRGRYCVRLRDFQQAIDDFGCGLVACDRHSNDYHRESLHFMRAYARLEVGNKEGAVDDLANVRDDFTLWIDSLCTKTKLLARC